MTKLELDILRLEESYMLLHYCGDKDEATLKRKEELRKKREKIGKC